MPGLRHAWHGALSSTARRVHAHTGPARAGAGRVGSACARVGSSVTVWLLPAVQRCRFLMASGCEPLAVACVGWNGTGHGRRQRHAGLKLIACRFVPRARACVGDASAPVHVFPSCVGALDARVRCHLIWKCSAAAVLASFCWIWF